MRRDVRIIDPRYKNDLERTVFVSLLGILTGVAAAFSAAGFKYMIALVYNLLYHRSFSFVYDIEASYTLDAWPWQVIFLLPAVGIVLSNWITRNLAIEARGTGVPEVIYAVRRKGGLIRPKAAVVKALAAAVTIGAGGSVGRVGPVVQIGSSLGSTLGQRLRLSAHETILLIGCGAAGSIAATFNAPLTGLFFALELIIPGHSLMILMPLLAASLSGAAVSNLLFGAKTAFEIPVYLLSSKIELLLFLLLGLISGLVAILYCLTVDHTVTLADRLKLPWWVKSLIGGALIGSSGLVCQRICGRLFVFGIGHDLLDAILHALPLSLFSLLVLILLKILGNAITLASGGSGGVFAPSLFIGATLGYLFGTVAGLLFGAAVSSPVAYAIAGMAAVLSASTGLTLTGVLITSELTGSYSLLIPVMLTVIASRWVSAYLYGRTIYSQKLMERGIPYIADH